MWIRDGIVARTHSDMRAQNPGVSMPEVISDDNVDHLGYILVETTEPPAIGPFELLVSGEPEEYEPGKWREVWLVQPTPVPQSVTPLQAKAELLVRGLLDEVETIINAAPDPVVPLAWGAASEFSRQSPMILGIAQVMGWDDAYLDEMFRQAAERVF